MPKAILAMFIADDDKLITHVHPIPGWTHEHYGLALCDLVRHAARAIGCDEEQIWEWVQRERDHPTANLMRLDS